MRNAAGFTLIELVIVIIVLGVLGAVSAPKFVRIQGDAYSAKVNEIKNSITTTMRLVHYKSSLAGKDSGASEALALEGITGGITVKHGYPAATDLIKVLTIDAQEAQTGNASAGVSTPQAPYVFVLDGTDKITLYPTARYNTDCFVSYEVTNPPKIVLGARTEC